MIELSEQVINRVSEKLSCQSDLTRGEGGIILCMGFRPSTEGHEQED